MSCLKCHTYWPYVRIDFAEIARQIFANYHRQLVVWNHVKSSESLRANHLVDSPMMRWHRKRIWNRVLHQRDWLLSCYTCLWMLNPFHRCHVYDVAMCTYDDAFFIKYKKEKETRNAMVFSLKLKSTWFCSFWKICLEEMWFLWIRKKGTSNNL